MKCGSWRDRLVLLFMKKLAGSGWKIQSFEKTRFQKDPMALKSADDKSKRLVLLEELQRSPALDLSQKKWLRDELMRTRRGIQGERESAHYLDH